MVETTLTIDGMMCGMCEAHLCDMLRNTFPVKRVSASHSKGRAVVLSEQALEEEALRAAIAQTGYTLTAVNTQEVEARKGLFGLLKR